MSRKSFKQKQSGDRRKRNRKEGEQNSQSFADEYFWQKQY